MGLIGPGSVLSGPFPRETGYFLELTEKYGLLTTGGSDFHGAINPEIHIGTGTGDLAVPYIVYERLAEEIRNLTAISSNQNDAYGVVTS
ncbi:MAG: hypothetical protein R2874_05140 [Desulfobacterales bacterium]